MSNIKKQSLLQQIGWGIVVYLWALVIGPMALFAHNAWLKWTEAGGFWLLCLIMLIVTYLLGILCFALRKVIPASYYQDADPGLSKAEAERKAKQAAKKDYTWHLVIPLILNGCWVAAILYDQLS